MGGDKYNEPTSFEEMAEQVEKTEAPGKDPGVAQDPGKTVEQTEATE
jgi:hypothetical protein